MLGTAFVEESSCNILQGLDISDLQSYIYFLLYWGLDDSFYYIHIWQIIWTAERDLEVYYLCW
jgi:hypothetical protein